MCYKPKKKILRNSEAMLYGYLKKHMIIVRSKRFGPSRSVIVHKHICWVWEGPLAADWAAWWLAGLAAGGVGRSAQDAGGVA